VSDSVIFTGYLPQREALRYVDAAEVCLSPFFPTPILNSTSPTKLIEYMAMTKPVVANDHPEQRLVISESGGGICVAYEEGKFAEAIVALLRDPELAREMGQKGRQYVAEKRTYSKLADVVEAKYLEMCP
jgi:glycosyltransferase involved in cell wall biosynthesis